MDVEVNLNKLLYKLTIVAIKILPILIAAMAFTRTTLYCLQIDLPILSYIGGVSLLTVLFLYLVSYAFKFCEYHRMFIHYIVVNDIINYIDYYIGIPLNYWELLKAHFIITGIFLFIILYLHQRWQRHQKNLLSNSLRE